MPRKSEFVLKDSPPEVVAAFPNVIPKGRTYNGDIAKEKAGAARIDEILLGTKLACVSVTDDKEDTLKNVAKLNPWHEVALTTITGSVEEAHKPLTHILDKHFGLTLDHCIDIKKLAGGIHSVDTQGYIAHNDEISVVSFRCTTSAFDWMTNFSIASSEWELEEDVAQGHSGLCSCFDGQLSFWKGSEEKKPRVHTGFYNNILQVIPLLQEYVDPLLVSQQPDQPPRTLYVVGHSLGGGISTMATAYFLLSHDWTNLPHKLLNISAGTPRACKSSMANVLEEKLAILSPLNKANVFRIVMDEDAVCRIPSHKTGYSHVGRTIFLTEDGEVLVNPRVELGLGNLWSSVSGGNGGGGSDPTEQIIASEIEEGEKMPNETTTTVATTTSSKYQEIVAKIPKPFRDHCPDCYLEPLVELYERENKKDSNQLV